MPRISAEARAASPVAGSCATVPPPTAMTREAKAIWRSIIREKPADWWNSAALELLAQFCEMSVTQTMLVAKRRAIDSLQFESVEAEFEAQKLAISLEKRCHKYAATLSTLATKLRLSVQAGVDRKSGLIDEAGASSSSLLGGNAVSFDDERRRRVLS